VGPPWLPAYYGSTRAFLPGDFQIPKTERKMENPAKTGFHAAPMLSKTKDFQGDTL
jgi:hypothetical protein